ncbi:MAG: hypothetical protein QM676_13835 [Novosphingobium sp.]
MDQPLGATSPRRRSSAAHRWLGEHNGYACRGLLGLPQACVADLTLRKVID